MTIMSKKQLIRASAIHYHERSFFSFDLSQERDRNMQDARRKTQLYYFVCKKQNTCSQYNIPVQLLCAGTWLAKKNGLQKQNKGSLSTFVETTNYLHLFFFFTLITPLLLLCIFLLGLCTDRVPLKSNIIQYLYTLVRQPTLLPIIEELILSVF